MTVPELLISLRCECDNLDPGQAHTTHKHKHKHTHTVVSVSPSPSVCLCVCVCNYHWEVLESAQFLNDKLDLNLNKFVDFALIVRRSISRVALPRKYGNFAWTHLQNIIQRIYIEVNINLYGNKKKNKEKKKTLNLIQYKNIMFYFYGFKK